MKKQFVPAAWVERGGMAWSYEINDDRRWFDRRAEVRGPDRRATPIESAVHEHLLAFCAPAVRNQLESKLGRESARFAKAA